VQLALGHVEHGAGTGVEKRARAAARVTAHRAAERRRATTTFAECPGRRSSVPSCSARAQRVRKQGRFPINLGSSRPLADLQRPVPHALRVSAFDGAEAAPREFAPRSAPRRITRACASSRMIARLSHGLAAGFSVEEATLFNLILEVGWSSFAKSRRRTIGTGAG